MAGCDRTPPRGEIVVSVIGPPLETRRGAVSDPPSAPELALRGATGLGLLRFDENAQLVPGVAARWALIDDGLDGIFRIDTTDGPSSRQVAVRLRRSLGGEGGRLGQGIVDIVPVTPTVVDLRLAEPRSELLDILAMPALATIDPAGGPMRIGARKGDAVLLDPNPAAGADRPARIVLRGEGAGRAVARFLAGKAQLVTGGTFADLPVAIVAPLPRGALRFDRPTGLFGLVPVAVGSAYADPQLVRLLSLALDRDRIAALTGAPGSAKATTLAGSRYEAPLAERRAQAVARIGAWQPLPPMRVRMPAGPGAALLFRLIARDWAMIGIEALRVGAGAAADLALVDLVVPPGERARSACAAAAGCDVGDKRMLLEPPYVAIGTPVRWSLVAPELDLFAENGLAIHPLDRLRSAR